LRRLEPGTLTCTRVQSTATAPRLTLKEVVGNAKVIDCDTHYTEPPDLWTSRAPATMKDKMPYMKTVNGQSLWFIEGDKPFGMVGTTVVNHEGQKIRGKLSIASFEEMDEASYKVKPRLEVMDRMGVWAQIVYPNLAGFGNQRFLKIDDADLRNACVLIYNDAMAELQQSSGERIFPMALIPWWDIAAAVKEVERAHGMGLRGIVTTSDPESAGLPDIAQPDWDPFWEACGALGMPINFHIAASDTGWNMLSRASWKSAGPEVKLALGSANLFLDNARVLGNLLYSGVPERFPHCRFVSVESGIGWIPFFLEALDHQARETAPHELRHLKLKPSEYFRRQVYACFWFETLAPQRLIADIGVGNVLFETDFPHPTCLYPENREHVAKVLGQLDANTRRRVLQDNAAELYRIPVG